MRLPVAGSGSMVTVSPSISTAAPRERSIPAVMSTSPSRGALRTTLGVSASRAATMSLVTAFFDPEMRTSPRRGPTGSIPHVTWPGELAGGGEPRPTGSGTGAIMAPAGGLVPNRGGASRPAAAATTPPAGGGWCG